MIHNTSWPYANETGITEKLNCDVLVLGGDSQAAMLLSPLPDAVSL